MPHKATPEKTHVIKIILGNITTLDVDAIVNAANEALLPAGGVCGAIHGMVGPEPVAACRPLAPCPTASRPLIVAPQRSANLSLPNRRMSSAKGSRFRAIYAAEDQAAQIAVSTICEMAGKLPQMPQIYLCWFSPSARQHFQTACHHVS